MLLNPLRPLKKLVTLTPHKKSEPTQKGCPFSKTSQAHDTVTSPQAIEQATTENQPHRDMKPVDSGNPCPFLRGLIGADLIPNGEVPISQLLTAIDRMMATRDAGTPDIPLSSLRAVALTANGVSPRQIAHNTRRGVNLNTLREGPFYKHGANSRTIDEYGIINHDELLRLASFGSPKVATDGAIKLGLNEHEISTMLKANFLRGTYPGHYRHLKHYPIMKAEYPVLLKVMGKQGKTERYLSVSELANLLNHNQLPERMLNRLTKNK